MYQWQEKIITAEHEHHSDAQSEYVWHKSVHFYNAKFLWHDSLNITTRTWMCSKEKMQMIWRFLRQSCFNFLFLNSPEGRSEGRDAKLFARLRSSQSRLFALFLLLLSVLSLSSERVGEKMNLKEQKSPLSSANDRRRAANVCRRNKHGERRD